MSRADAVPTRDAYPHFSVITMRWMDNDTYGHVNNVQAPADGHFAHRSYRSFLSR